MQKKGKLWANDERNEETVDTERQKNFWFLPVPRAAAAYGRQLKITTF